MLISLRNGIQLNYSKYGENNDYSLLFIHGNNEDQHLFDSYINSFINCYTIYTVDSRCHGDSSFGELSYDLMAEDIELFIEELNIKNFALIGFSDGAIISLKVALKLTYKPKLFLIGPNITVDGLTSECINELKEENTIYSKLCLSDPNISLEDLNTLKNRTVIIGGENDLIKRDHFELIKNNVFNSTLYIINGANHFMIESNKDDLIDIINNELKYDIYYEDNHVLVIDKPCGMLSQSDISGETDALSFYKGYLKWRYKKSGSAYLGLVQRLDRNVSGLMILSKSSKAHERLNKERPQKKYMALCYGIFEKTEDRIINKISKDEKMRKAFLDDINGKESILNYKVIKNNENYSLLDVYIETGRFHQIRFQLSYLGHPIFNDYKYSQKIMKENFDLGLDAYHIEFTHPITKKNIIIEREPKRLTNKF